MRRALQSLACAVNTVWIVTDRPVSCKFSEAFNQQFNHLQMCFRSVSICSTIIRKAQSLRSSS